MEEEDMNCTSGKNKLKTILNSHKIGEYTTEEETAFMTDFFRLYHHDWDDKNLGFERGDEYIIEAETNHQANGK